MSAPTNEHHGLFSEAQRVGDRFLRARRLPPHYAASGAWTDESIEDAVSQWLAERLVGRGDLKRMAFQTQDLATFRAMLTTSLRQDIIDRLERTESRNLYARICKVLEDEARFSCVGESASRQHRVWAIAGSLARFEGDDRAFVNAAYAAGDFSRVHYRADAGKLSPVLSSPDLLGFLEGLLRHGAMSASEIMVAINGRYGLSVTAFAELGENIATPDTVADALMAEEAAAIMLEELTPRQLDVLRLSSDCQTVREVAGQLGCSPATVMTELQRIRECHHRLGLDDPAVLNAVVDLAFQLVDDHTQKAAAQ